MVMTDPIADLLTRIRNANAVKHEVVEVPSSSVKKAITNILLHTFVIYGYFSNISSNISLFTFYLFILLPKCSVLPL